MKIHLFCSFPWFFLLWLCCCCCALLTGAAASDNTTAAAATNASNDDSTHGFHVFTDDFIGAFQNTFAALNGMDGIEKNQFAVQRIYNLMKRGGIPTSADELQPLTPKDLLRLGMLAAVANISPWQRPTTNSTVIYLTEDGIALLQNTVSTIESNIMLCVVCSLLTVIASMHLLHMKQSS